MLLYIKKLSCVFGLAIVLAVPITVFAGAAPANTVIGVGEGGVTTPTQATCSITSFMAAKTSLDAGATTTLTWNTAGCTTVVLNGAEVRSSGSKQSDVMGTINKSYILYASNSTVSTQQSIVLTAAAPVDTCSISSFTANPTSTAPGGTSTLSWNTSGCTSVLINGAAVSTVGTKIYNSGTTATTYVLSARSSIEGAVEKKQSVVVGVTGTTTTPPSTTGCTISSLTATPTTVSSGGSSILAWVTTGCTTLFMDGDTATATGYKSTGALSASRTFSLVGFATGSATPQQKSVTVQVGSSASSTSTTTTTTDTASTTSTEPSIAVLAPIGGESFLPGRQITVQWTTKNIPTSETVRVALLSDENAGLVAINPMTFNNTGQGLFTLPGASELANTVPALSQGRRFKIMVYSTQYNVKGTSASNFSIGSDGSSGDISNNNPISTNSGVVVVSPNGGEAYAQGTPISISWKNGRIDTRIALMNGSATIADQSAVVGWISLTGGPSGTVSWDGKGVYKYTNSSGKTPVVPGDYRIVAVSQNSTGDYIIPGSSSASDANVDISNQPFTLLAAGAAGADTGIDEFAGTGENPIVTPEDKKMFDDSWEATGVPSKGATVIVEFPDSEPTLTVTDKAPSTSTTPSGPTTFKKLDRGAKGANVKTVQTALKKKGYLKARTTGFYGLLTKNAVKKYQKKVKLPVTGIVDKKTFSLLTGK